MKKILFILAIVTVFVSCEKENENDNLCPVISEKAIPSSVINAFQAKYPNAVVETWFNKDNAGFCALFTFNGKETKVLYDNAGNFQREEIDQQGDHQDNEDEGCECELEDND